MKAENLERIETDAEELLRAYYDRFGGEIAPPVPVELIAELFYGLRIDRDKLERDSPGKFDLNNKIIILNCGDSIERQRFTVAHEIGHLRLHLNHSKSHLTLRRAKGGRMETEANAFAAALLLPRKLCYEILIKEIFAIRRSKQKDIEWLLIPTRRSRSFKALNHLLCSYLFEDRKGRPERMDRAGLLVSVIPRIARKFQVSRDALTWRLKNLGVADEFIRQME